MNTSSLDEMVLERYYVLTECEQGAMGREEEGGIEGTGSQGGTVGRRAEGVQQRRIGVTLAANRDNKSRISNQLWSRSKLAQT